MIGTRCGSTAPQNDPVLKPHPLFFWPYSRWILLWPDEAGGGGITSLAWLSQTTPSSGEPGHTSALSPSQAVAGMHRPRPPGGEH